MIGLQLRLDSNCQIEKVGALHLALFKWRKEYGDIYQLWLGIQPYLHIHDLEVLKVDFIYLELIIIVRLFLLRKT